jgi:hypothetical protein
LYLVEKLYERGLTNQDIAKKITELGINKRDEIFADSAEPKSIEEVYRMGFNIKPTAKGKDSIINSIDILRRFKIFLIGSNLQKEFRTYKWKTDKAGKAINEPVDFNNHCFVGDTLVTTNKGQLRIDKIKVGDLVLTSKGYKRVLKVWDNGVKQVEKYSMQLDTNVVYLIGTKDHKIKTTNSWTELSKLKEAQKLYQHKPLTEKDTHYTQTKVIIVEVIKDFMLKFGNTIKVKYLKAIMFTTLMLIKAITTFQILTLFIKHCICVLKVKKDLKTILSLQKSFTQKELKQQKSGISQMRGLSGISSMVKIVGLTDHLQKRYASNAEKLIQQDVQGYPNSAIKIVKLKHLEQGVSYKANVYDLMIEDCHEYFANGILVHNCIDASRYLALMKLNENLKGKYVTIRA